MSTQAERMEAYESGGVPVAEAATDYAIPDGFPVTWEDDILVPLPLPVPSTDQECADRMSAQRRLVADSLAENERNRNLPDGEPRDNTAYLKMVAGIGNLLTPRDCDSARWRYGGVAEQVDVPDTDPVPDESVALVPEADTPIPFWVTIVDSPEFSARENLIEDGALVGHRQLLKNMLLRAYERGVKDACEFLAGRVTREDDGRYRVV